MNQIEKLESLKSYINSLWGERIVSQLLFAHKMLQCKGLEDERFSSAVDYIYDYAVVNNSIGKEAAICCEDMISHLSGLAKEYKMICAGHAHIDMNWMWDFGETVKVTTDTFRTMLTLMKEYPDFTFSQSQASTYQIIEEYDPDMLNEIKERIKEGRWEVTASTWVETDKNMPNGESLARHILYTKKYLSSLLEISPDDLTLDFEPDTFGHNQNVPEILNKGGVKYYYHCRGRDVKYDLYRWESPSKKSIIVYREPAWYNFTISGEMIAMVPDYAKKAGVPVILKVYGVGDHGGGPTRRDIEKIIEISKWPVAPTVKFGTYNEFFKEVEPYSDSLPVENTELNYIFTGCYTSQSRIKMANRLSEDRLYESEAISSFSTLYAECPNLTGQFEKAWQNVMFNHFHDILPGSGVIDTREYAMGLFQKTMGYSNVCRGKALRALADKIDTSSIEFDNDKYSIAEGAGVGIKINNYNIPEAERGRGKVRVYHFFNPTQYDLDTVSIINLWDWNYDLGRLVIYDSKRNKTVFSIIENIAGGWGHSLVRLAVKTKIPAFGYSTYVAELSEMTNLPIHVFTSEHEELWETNILENKQLKAVFEQDTMRLISLTDKKTGKELINKPSCIFSYVDESTSKGMTAWINGETMSCTDLNASHNVKVIGRKLSGLRKWIKYQIGFKSSLLTVTVSIDDNSSRLDFNTELQWKEFGTPATSIPKLLFTVPVGYNSSSYKYDIPFGTVIRAPMNHDVPANSFCAAVNDTDSSLLQVICDTKYGFVGYDNSISVDLVRSSYDPDPYPEVGNHNIRIGVAIADDSSDSALYENASLFTHLPLYTTGTCQKGSMPMESSFMTLSGDVTVSAIKLSEKDASVLIVRLYASDINENCSIKFNIPVSKAYVSDINENLLSELSVQNDTIAFDANKNSVLTIAVKF